MGYLDDQITDGLRRVREDKVNEIQVCRNELQAIMNEVSDTFAKLEIHKAKPDRENINEWLKNGQELNSRGTEILRRYNVKNQEVTAKIKALQVEIKDIEQIIRSRS